MKYIASNSCAALAETAINFFKALSVNPAYNFFSFNWRQTAQVAVWVVALNFLVRDFCMSKERNTFKEKKKPAQQTKKEKNKAKKAKHDSLGKTSPEVKELT